MANDHKDYSGTPLPKKLGIREGSRVMLVGAPDGFDGLLTPMPDGVTLLKRGGGASSTSPCCSRPNRPS